MESVKYNEGAYRESDVEYTKEQRKARIIYDITISAVCLAVWVTLAFLI